MIAKLYVDETAKIFYPYFNLLFINLKSLNKLTNILFLNTLASVSRNWRVFNNRMEYQPIAEDAPHRAKGVLKKILTFLLTAFNGNFKISTNESKNPPPPKEQNG